MIALALFLIAAAVAHGLAHLLRLSPIPILLGTGLAISYFVPDLPAVFLQNILEIGLLFLVFAAGVELNPGRGGGRGRRRGVILVAFVQFVVLGALGYVLARLLAYDSQTALYIAFALSASSTLVVVRVLKQRQQMFEPFGRLVTGVLLLQDIMIIIGMVVLLRLPEGSLAVADGLVATTMLGGLAWVGHRWIVPFLILRLNLDEETRLLAILSLLFAYTGLAWLLDLPLVAGAFLAGFALSSFPVSGLARSQLLSLNGFFLTLFFLALGALIVLPDWAATGRILVFAVFVIVVTVPLVAAIAERMGYSARASIESGLLLSQTSEFSLIVALQGWISGQITSETFSTIAVLTVALMTATPYLATDQNTWRLMRLHPMRRRRTSAQIEGGHVLLLGFGSVGEALMRALGESSRPVVIVDEDAAVVQRLRARGFTCLRGDGSDERLLEQANARQAAAIVSSMRRVGDTEKILDFIRAAKVPVILRVLEEQTAARVRAKGGHPVVMIDPTVDLFMHWLHENEV